MSQVSNYPLNKEIEERMFGIFWQTLAQLNTTSSVYKFLNDLLTSTEKIMLAKRLSIALLLIKGYDYRTISKSLRVSTATIMLINAWLKTGGEGYKMVIKKILQEEKTEDFWDNFEEKMSNLLPPRRGTNWSEVRSQQWQKRLSRRRKRALL